MAERLTRKSMAGNFFIPHGINIYDVYAKLAFYEDSGLTSAEVFELAKAKAEGKLLILPFATGGEKRLGIVANQFTAKTDEGLEIKGKVIIVETDLDECNRHDSKAESALKK